MNIYLGYQLHDLSCQDVSYGCITWCYLVMLPSCSLLSGILCDVGVRTLSINIQKRGSDPMAETCSACSSEWINVIIAGTASENQVFVEKVQYYTFFPDPFLVLAIGSIFSHSLEVHLNEQI